MLNPLRRLASSAACNGNAIANPTTPNCRNLRIHARCVGVEGLLDGRGNAALIVVQSNGPAVLLQVIRRVTHDDRMSSKGQHLNVIVIVADGHDLSAIDAAVVGPPLQRVSLRAASVEDINDA